MTASRLSILHVLAPARYGGLERVVGSLAAGQRDAGIDARVLAIIEPDARTHPFVEALRCSGVAVDTLVVPPRRYLAERHGVAEFCRRAGPTVVHVHGTRPDVLDAAAIQGAGFRVISTVHGFTGGDLKNRVYEALQRRALRHADAVVAVSRPLARDLLRSGVPADRVHMVPNAAPPHGVPLSRSDARAELGIPTSERVIGWVGRLTREKGCDVLLEAVATIDQGDVTVSIVGSGAERAALQRTARDAGLGSRVRWHDEVPSAGRILAAFDVLAISSRSEGTPMVLFEAIQARVPIVTTSVGGIPDVVSSAEAILVDASDRVALAEGLRRALDDREGAAQRATSAAALLEHEFALSRWIARYSAVYEAAMRVPLGGARV